MSFVASDGLNYETANSYTSVEYADDYFSIRGNDTWLAAAINVKEAALVKATDYIEQLYSSRWIGNIYRSTGLSWPRNYTNFNYDVIPENLKKATCELALEALTEDLNPVIKTDAAVKREKVDVIEKEYFEAKYDKSLRPAVIGYLLPLIGGSIHNRNVVRV